MVTANVIKTTTRTTLKNKWGEAIFAGLQFLAVFLILMMLSSLVLSVFSGNQVAVFSVMIVYLILLPPAFLGVVRWFWAFIIGETLKLSEIFYYFSSVKHIFNSVFLTAYTVANCFICAIFSFLPATFVYVISKGEILSKFGLEIGDKTLSAMPIVIVFALVGALVFLKATLRYIFSFVVVVANEEISPYDAVRLSRKITANCRFSLVGLFFSYIGWLALSILGVTLIYTIPLLLCSYVVTGRILITNYCLDNGIEGIK